MSKIFVSLTILIGFGVGHATVASGEFADQFVKMIAVISTTAGPTQSLIYGNSDFGYFETMELSQQGMNVSARLVPPGFRSPIEIYLKKRMVDGTTFLERAGNLSFTFPLSAAILDPRPLPVAAPFTSNFFLGTGQVSGGSIIFLTNKFAEIVWVYRPSPQMGGYFFVAKSLGKGKFGLLGMAGYFETVSFDGSVEKQIQIQGVDSAETHHDFLFTSPDNLITLGWKMVDFGGKTGSTLAPGRYRIATVMKVGPNSPKGVTVWTALNDVISLLEARSANYPVDAAHPFSNQKGTPIDLDHSNAIDHVPGKGYLVSIRNFNTIAFFDEAFHLLWSLGSAPGATISTLGTNMEFFHQHNPTVLPNGDILLFDNGRSKSRVLQLRVNPATQSVTLVQECLPDLPLYGRMRGSAHRLSNGNTVALINSTASPIEEQHTVEFDSTGKQTAIMSIPNSIVGDGYRIQPVDTIGNEAFLGTKLPIGPKRSQRK